MYACIYELRKNCCGTGRDGTGGESKVLQEVLADLKIITQVDCLTVAFFLVTYIAVQHAFLDASKCLDLFCF